MKKILVIDDDDNILDAISVILTAKGYAIETATDGSQGCKKAINEDFDLVITDILMPAKEGLETIMDLKKAKPDQAIMAMSSGGHNDQRKETYLLLAKSLGALSSLEKPFQTAELIKRVEFCLGDHFSKH